MNDASAHGMRFSCFSANDIVAAGKKVKRGNKYIKSEDKDFPSFDYFLGEKRKENRLKKYFDNEKVEIPKLHSSLEDGTYKMYPYSGIAIDRKPKKPRTILAPAPADRVVFTAVLKKLQPKFSYIHKDYNIFGSGQRSDYPTIRSLLLEISKQTQTFDCILKVDIKDFFPSIKQSLVLDILNQHNVEQQIVDLIHRSFQNSIAIVPSSRKHAKYFPNPESGIGIPQGCAYSPLLANVYALEIDKWLALRSDCVAYRYLDDLIVLTKTKGQAERIFAHVDKMAKRIGLHMHPLEEGGNKSYITRTNKPFEYLGINLHNGGLYIPKEKVRKACAHIEKNLCNKDTVAKYTVEEVVEVTGWFTRGWKQYYSSTCPEHYAEIIGKVNELLKLHYQELEKKFFSNDTVFSENKEMYL